MLLGTVAGRQATVSGNYNKMFGTAAGEYAKVAGSHQSFIGAYSGRSANIKSGADYNTFVGFYAGREAVFESGKDGNTLIGKDAMRGRTINTNGGTYIGGSGVKIVTGGAFQKCNASGGSCQNVQLTGSSKVYKKNIKPFKDFEKSLEDILKTPLFTYQFKDKGDHPHKKRMGLIAEELPESLQLKEEPITPDWPSVYGTLWAGIKALHKRIKAFVFDLSQIHLELKELKAEKNSQIKKLIKENSQLKTQLKETNKALAKTNKRLKEIEKKLKGRLDY